MTKWEQYIDRLARGFAPIPPEGYCKDEKHMLQAIAIDAMAYSDTHYTLRTTPEFTLKAMRTNEKVLYKIANIVVECKIEPNPIVMNALSDEQKILFNDYRKCRQLAHDLNIYSINHGNKDIFCKVSRITSHIFNLEEVNLSIAEFTEILTYTKALLEGNMSVKKYSDKAHTLQGHANPGLKILSGVMIALGIIIASMSFSLGPLSVGGVAIATLGCMFFVNSGSSGLSKEMHDLGDYTNRLF